MAAWLHQERWAAVGSANAVPMKRSSAIVCMCIAVFADHLEPVANDVQHDKESEEAPQRLVLQRQHDQQHGRRHAATQRQGRDETNHEQEWQ
jgi:hypothetical protein